MDGLYEFILKSTNVANTGDYKYKSCQLKENLNDPDPLFQSVLIILIIAGTIGNLLVCLAILLDRKLQNLANYFLLSLAGADLLISLLIWPGRLITVLYHNKVKPNVIFVTLSIAHPPCMSPMDIIFSELKPVPSIFPWLCLYLVGNNFFTYASAIHICFISFERYLAIRNPFNRRNLTKGRVTVKIGLVWFFAFLAVIPLITLAIIKIHPGTRMTCDEVASTFIFVMQIIFIDAIVIGIMLVAVVLSLVLTTVLLHKLVKKQEKNMARGNSGLVRTVGGITAEDKLKDKKLFQELRSEQKALRVVWLVTFAFIICWAPYTCIRVLLPEFNIPVVLQYLAQYLNYIFPVLNPILYTIFNKTFRDNFKNLILFEFKKSK